MHDLLQHSEEMHAPTQGSFGAPAKPVQDEAPLIPHDESTQALEKEQAQTQRSFSATPKTDQTDSILPSLEHVLGLLEISLSKGSPPSLMESIQPDLDPIPEISPYITTKESPIAVKDSENGRVGSDVVDEMKKAFERLNHFSSPHNEKPFKCLVIGCEKAYKNLYALKYEVLD